MDLDVVFLGTGGSVPTARRSTAAVLVRRGGERLLFDCGEGTQRQMQRSTGLVNLDRIFITHYHADHWLGLPGLLKTYDLQGRETPLTIHGPPGLRDLMATLGRLIGRTTYELELDEIEPGDSVDLELAAVHPFPVEHRARAQGYALVEEPRPGRFDTEAANALGVSPGPDFGALQRGEDVAGTDGPVSPDQVMGETRPGRKVVITGDTAPCESTKIAAHQADLLVHDGSFAAEEAERAAETGHSTAKDAARLARDAEVRYLALVHVSSRYNVTAVVEEAREEYPGAEAPRDFDIVEIPFPERGEPRLIPKGARVDARGGGPRGRQRPTNNPHSDRRGVVLLEEMLGGQLRRRGRRGRRRPCACARARAPDPRLPRPPARANPRAEPGPEELLLRLGQLEPAHHLEEGATAVVPLQQLVVGEEFVPGYGGAVGDALQVEELGERPAIEGAQPDLTDASHREGVHRPGAAKAGGIDEGIQRGQRKHPFGIADRPLEADRSTNVVDDQMAAFDVERCKRRVREGRQARPAVVVAGWSLGEAEAGEIEGDGAKPTVVEERHDLPVQVAGGGNAVKEHHRLAVAAIEREAAHPIRGERASARLVLGNRRFRCRIHRGKPLTAPRLPHRLVLPLAGRFL